MKKNLLIAVIVVLWLTSAGSLLAQTYHFQEGFVTNAPPTGWIATNVAYSTNYNNNLYTGTYSLKLKPNESFLITKAVNTAAILEFYVRVRDTTKLSDFHLKIEKSYDKVAWTELKTDPCNMKNDSVFQKVTIPINDNATTIYIRFHAISVNGTATLGLCYIDDVSITKMVVSPSDATLNDLTYNGASIEGFAASILEYAKEVPYSVEQIAIGGVLNNPGASMVITNPTNLRGYLADRTGSVKVTSQDGTVTKIYKIVFTVSDYIYKVGFTLTGDGVMPVPGWRGGYTYTSSTIPMGNHAEFDGAAALKFMRGQPDKIGYLNTAKYIKSDSLSFWLAVDQPDGVENLLVEKRVNGGVKIIIDNINSSKMTGQWQQFKYKIGEADSTEIILTPTLTAEGLTRIWIDDLAMKGKKVSGLSIDEKIADKFISIYPNPVQAEMTVRIQKTESTSGYKEVKICDMTGRVLATQSINKEWLSLDVSSLPKGIYLLKFDSGNNSYSRKFVKN